METVTSVESRLMAAVARAVARNPFGGKYEVCIKSPDGEELVKVRLESYAQVTALADDLRVMGYRLQLLHPAHRSFDFVLVASSQ